MRALAVLAVLAACAGGEAAPSVVIHDWPITWTAERDRLMLAYRRAHSDPAATDLTIEPEVIVLHYTSGHSAKATHDYFGNTRMEASRKALRRGGAVNVSAHFLVDRDGTIYRLMPETKMARHCIGLNHVAIGIENVGDGDQYPLTDAQVDADAALITDLAARFPITTVIGHSEAHALEGGPYYVELARGYDNDKPDPGDDFMAKVRAKIPTYLSGASP